MESGPDYLNSDCIVVMGGNPLASHPARGVEVLEAKRKRGTKLIVIDPRRTELASKADLWLQIRPGTDVALALGMIKTIIDEELYDKAFVEKWCHGFEALRERAQEYPLEKVAELTWVPADKIRDAATLYAKTKPAAMHHRVAIEHNLNSVQTCRALAILVALTGNLDIPGGNLFPMSLEGYVPQASLWEAPRFKPDPEVDKKRIGSESYPLASGADAVFPFVVGPLANDAIRTGKPYPIKALFCSGGNPIVNSQNVKRVWENRNYFIKAMQDLGFDTGNSETPIVPVMCGESKRAKDLAGFIWKRGFFALPIVYPMVARDKARIRVQLCTKHTEDQLSKAVGVFEEGGRKLGLI
jgi:anaerobic selenocysteine-containing dehydrogenase